MTQIRSFRAVTILILSLIMTAAVLIIAPVSQAKKDKIKATKIELSAETTKIEVGKTTKLQIKLNKKNIF